MIPSEINHEKQWKYAKAEFERRFLISPQPKFLKTLEYKEITDKYFNNTNLRLRYVRNKNSNQYKLTKKLPVECQGRFFQWVSTIYLREDEYMFFNELKGDEISKRRYKLLLESGKSVGIDEIKFEEKTIWIAEVEFEENESIDISLPFETIKEVSNEVEYLGNELAKKY